jgi:hypothetical protein
MMKTENERKEMRAWMDQHVIVLGADRDRAAKIKDVLVEKLTPSAVEKIDEESKKRDDDAQARRERIAAEHGAAEAKLVKKLRTTKKRGAIHALWVLSAEQRRLTEVEHGLKQSLGRYKEGRSVLSMPEREDATEALRLVEARLRSVAQLIKEALADARLERVAAIESALAPSEALRIAEEKEGRS